jgi:hypothetical protein
MTGEKGSQSIWCVSHCRVQSWAILGFSCCSGAHQLSPAVMDPTQSRVARFGWVSDLSSRSSFGPSSLEQSLSAGGAWPVVQEASPIAFVLQKTFHAPTRHRSPRPGLPKGWPGRVESGGGGVWWKGGRCDTSVVAAAEGWCGGHHRW